jgi:hypothetical protein
MDCVLSRPPEDVRWWARLTAVTHCPNVGGRNAGKPMTEEEWIRERATVIDVTPEN